MLKTLSSLLLIPTLVGGALMPAEAKHLTIQIDEDRSLIPTDVTYQHIGDAIQVNGWIQKRQPHRGRILGHVEIRLRDAAGQIVTEQQAAMVQYSPSRKDPQKARFSATLEHASDQAVTLEVAHQVGDAPTVR
jgi:hypothetical protein